MGSCVYNYKGNTYSEKEVKPVVSYHYMVENAVLQSPDISKIDNVLQVQEVTDYGDSPVTVVPDVTELIQSINAKYGDNSEIVTVDNNGIVDIDITPIAQAVINKALGDNSDPLADESGTNTQQRKSYNLQGISDETLEDMEAKVSIMESKFADLGVATHFILDGDLDASGQLLGTSDPRYKDMIASGEINDSDGVIVVNPKLLYSDTVFHEYGHLFIDLMGGMNNPRIKYAYSKIQNSPLVNTVRVNYPELTGDNLAKEIMATAIGKEATDIFEAGNPEIGFIQKFLNWIREGVSNILGIQTTSIKDLANELLGDNQSLNEFDNSLDTQTQLFKNYTKDTPKVDRMLKGAEQTATDIATRTNIVLNSIGNTTQEDKVTFKSTLKKLSGDIETLGKNKSLESIGVYLDTARTMGTDLEEELTEFLDKANEGENITLSYNLLNRVNSYKDLFYIIDEIQNSATSGYFKAEFKKQGWTDEVNKEFIESINSAKLQFDRVHDLHIKTGRHHSANRMAKYSNRSIVLRRIELEKEFKELSPRQNGESRQAYNARIREKVDKKIVEELPTLKERERELIYNRLNSSPADIAGFASWVSSEKDLNSMVIQLASKILDEADLKRDMQMQDKKLKAYKVFEAFDKETNGLGAKEKYKGLYQEGSDGKLYIAGEYDVEWYIQSKKVYSDLYEAENKYGKGSPEWNAAKEDRNKWLLKNAKKVYVLDTNQIRPKDNWKNKEYSNIMSKPESGRAQMLQYLIEGNQDNTKMLHGNRSLVNFAPGSDIKFIKAPSIGRSTFEKAVDGNPLAGIQDSLERIYKTKTDDEDLVGDIDAEKDGLKVIANRKGDIKHGVPIHFRGDMGLKDISYDLMSSHLMDSYMAMNYKYKSALQIELELMKDIVAEKDVTQTTGIIKKVLLNAFDKKTATEIVKKGSNSNELKALESLIDNRIYGLKDTNKEYAKVVGSIMSWSASTMLMFNLPSAMTNVLQGKVFNFIEGVSGEYYNRQDLRDAEKEFFGDINALMGDMGKPVARSKTKQMMELLNLQGEFKALSSKMIENSRFKALVNSNSAYALSHIGETYMHATLMYAILNNIKMQNANGQFIDKNGKVVSKDKAMNLTQALSIDEKTGKLALNEYAYKTSYGNSPIVLGTREKGLLEIKGLVNKIAHDLHGNYNEEIQAMAQRYTILKPVFMLRKWIIPGFNKRWRGAAYFNKPQDELQDQVENFYSEDTQLFQEGYYATALRYINMVRKDLKSLQLEAFTANWDKLSDRELANMRRFITEVSIMALTFAGSNILLALAQGIDDDDENTKAALFHLTYYTRRMYSEMRFYSNPFEAYKIMKTPAASLAYVAKLGLFLDQVASDSYNITLGEGLEEYETGKRKGTYKIMKRTGDVVPIWNQGNSNIEESLSYMMNLH